MSKEEIEKMLEKQLALLSERSEGCLEDQDLVCLTKAMIEVTNLLLSP